MLKFYDIYFSFDATDGQNDAISLLFNDLNSIGLHCWKENLKAIVECPVFVVFISNHYIERSKCELEYAHDSRKVILPVLIEKLKLSQTAIGYIVNENETKYYSTFKKGFDWKKTLVETVIEKFKRDTVEYLDKNLFDLTCFITYQPFKMLNRMCKLENFIIVADWGLNSGIHLLDSKFNYLKSFNNHNKLKNVTGICTGQDDKTIFIATSVSKTKDNFVFVFNFNIEKLEFQEIYVFDNISDKERDLRGMEFNKNKNSVFIVDRLNKSILELYFDRHPDFIEYSLFNIPNFFKTPILNNIYFDDENGLIYAIDGKSGESGNCCVHKLQVKDDKFKWIGSFGNVELKKPSKIFKTKNNLFLILEKSNPSVLHIYDAYCIYVSSVRLNGPVHCSSILFINKNILVTNLSKTIFVYDENILKKFLNAEAKVSLFIIF
jgi:hypothetical protein